MKKYHMIIIVVWIGLSLFLMVGSYKLGLGKLHKPGTGLMPFLIGVFLFLLSIWLLIADLLGKGAREGPSEEQRKVNFKKSGIVVASLILYGLLLEKLGFLVVTFLLLFFLFWGMGVRRNAALAASVLTVLASYFVFTYLGLRFPPGVFRLVGL